MFVNDANFSIALKKLSKVKNTFANRTMHGFEFSSETEVNNSSLDYINGILYSDNYDNRFYYKVNMMNLFKLKINGFILKKT